jgi:hypothetical protein
MFDQTGFDREWECSTVEMPIRFECRFVKPLAQGAAQLSVLALGTISELIEKDTACGFSSPGVLAAAQIQGNTGDSGGSATYTIAQPCTLQFTQQTTDKTDCNQVTTYVTGQAMVTGTKTVRGYVSGDPNQAIVPTSRDPARVDLSATLTDLKVWKAPGGNAITLHSGQISGTVIPRLAIDQTTGACSIVTPVVEFDHVQVQGAQIGILSQNKYFEMRVDSSDLSAQNGNKNGTTNQLTGSISIDGEQFSIPAYGPNVLDPNYDQTAFDRSYACVPNLAVPADDAACSLKDVLGKGAARLLILSIGNLSKMANDDTGCGFSTQSVLTHPSQVVGDVGDMGLMAWDVSNCDLSRPGDQPFQTDCLGRSTYAGGGIAFSGSRVVTGIRNQVVILIIIRFDSIIPNAPDSATIHLDDVELNDFFVNQVEPGQSNPTRGLHVFSGSMSAEMHPVLGEEANTPGKFDVPTPIAHMINVTASNMSAQVMSQGKVFNVHIDSANLEAMNGSWNQLNLTNRLTGTISIDGQTITLSGTEGLDPAYMQADFDARYACTQNLASLVPPQ